MARIFKIFFKTTGILLGSVALGLAGLYVSLALSDGNPVGFSDVYQDSYRRPLVLAHRGGADLKPENTFEAFDHAVELQVDVLEIDVRTTSDGEFVVIHDSTVDRTTNGTGKVIELSLADVKRLDAAFRFTRDGGLMFPYRGTGVTVPTLSETLERYSGKNINIELKQVSGEKASELCEMLRTRIEPTKTVIASGSGEFLYPFREACPEYTTSATFTEVLDFLTRYKLGVVASYSPSMKLLQIPAGFRYLTILDPGFASAAKSKGLGIHVWTINDENEMRRLIRLGVDGIVTDKPDLLIKVINEELSR